MPTHTKNMQNLRQYKKRIYFRLLSYYYYYFYYYYYCYTISFIMRQNYI